MRRYPLLLAVVLLVSAPGAARTTTRPIIPNLVPSGPGLRSIINKAISANGGSYGWKWVRRLEFRQRFRQFSGTGRLLHFGRLFKQVTKSKDIFYSRCEDQSQSAPPFIRGLGPSGTWMLRGGLPLHDPILAKAYEDEAYRDFLIFSLPYILQWRKTVKRYQGIQPVRGVPCYQILVEGIPQWRCFEDCRLIVSLAVNDYRLCSLSFHPAGKDNERTDIFFSNHRTETDGTSGHTWRLARTWEILFPDGTTSRIVIDSLKVNPRQAQGLYCAPGGGKDSGTAKNREREVAHEAADRIPKRFPRQTFFVRPDAWLYYLRQKNRQARQ